MSLLNDWKSGCEFSGRYGLLTHSSSEPSPETRSRTFEIATSNMVSAQFSHWAPLQVSYFDPIIQKRQRKGTNWELFTWWSILSTCDVAASELDIAYQAAIAAPGSSGVRQIQASDEVASHPQARIPMCAYQVEGRHRSKPE